MGEPIPEKDYGGNCLVYDESTPEDPYHNLWDKVDVFIFAHLFGYWCKTLIFRDLWLCTVISVMFEFLEYSLEHQLPNFSECWWDHWILDVIVCNGGGTVLGLYTLRYLSIKTYNWRGLWNIPTYRGKIKRIIAQFRCGKCGEVNERHMSTIYFCFAVRTAGSSSSGTPSPPWSGG